MAAIRIARQHDVAIKDARRRVSRIAKGIAERFDVDTEWDENVLFFSRSGVNGRIVLDDGHVSVEADISFLLLPIKGAIESEIRRHLEIEFGS